MNRQLQLTCDDFDQLLESMNLFPIPDSHSVLLDLIKRRSHERIGLKAPNSYFVYRKVISDQLKDRSIKLPMVIISKLASYGWKKMSPGAKDAYEQLSKECDKGLNLRRNKYLVWAAVEGPKLKELKGRKNLSRKLIKPKPTKSHSPYEYNNTINFNNNDIIIPNEKQNTQIPLTPALSEDEITSSINNGSISSTSYNIINNEETNTFENEPNDFDSLYYDIPFNNSESYYYNCNYNDSNPLFFSPISMNSEFCDFQISAIREQLFNCCFFDPIEHY